MTKTVLITGASSGFGEACAKRFAVNGDRLILAARSVDKLKSLRDSLANKCDIFIHRLDVSSKESIDIFFSALPDVFSDIDILINNAGLALGINPAHEASLDDWETMIDTNIKGLVRITRQVLPAMVEKNSGHIINMGSIAGTWPYPGGNVYGSTKSFVQQFSRSLRADLLGKAIRVTNIDPGLAETNFSIVRMNGDIDKASSLYENTKPLVAEDIADIIFWVSSVPKHVNINTLEVMPNCQAWGPLIIHREREDQN